MTANSCQYFNCMSKDQGVLRYNSERIMKLLLFGKKAFELKPLLKQQGFTVVEDNPQVVITYGGDGTLLSAEREYPGVPKLAIRDNSICVKCVSHQDKELFKKLKEDRLPLRQLHKLEAKFNHHKLLAVNDFVIRNQLPIHAIRFQLFKNNQSVTDKLVIGDGVVASTAFGATGYFRSITRKTFSQNFGLTFNNTTEKLEPVYFKEADQIKVRIVRGPATLSYDNSPDIYTLERGSVVFFKPSSEKIKLYAADTLRCPSCQIVRRTDIP